MFKALILSTALILSPMTATAQFGESETLTRGPVGKEELQNSVLVAYDNADKCFKDAETVLNMVVDFTVDPPVVKSDIQSNLPELKRKLKHMEYCKNAYDSAMGLVLDLINNTYDERL